MQIWKLLFLALIILCSCSPRRVPSENEGAIKRLDALTQSSIDYVRHRDRILPSGQVEIYYTLRSLDRYQNISVDWKVVFYGPDGFPLEESDWNTIVFPINEEITIRANSFKRSVSSYQLVIRGAEL